jgi:hypothetical protein
MRHKLHKILLVAVLAFALCSGWLIGNRASAQSSSTTGTWTTYPQQETTYAASVRPPIKADGSSIFNGKGTSSIPIKFKLSTAPGGLKFYSVYSNNEVCEDCPDPENTDDFAFVNFTPSSTMTFNDITLLKANYAFTTGNCGGGSLRWAVTFDIGDDNLTDVENGPFNDRSIFIYYGGYPNFTDCTSGANNQSGVNMIGLSDLRYDTSQLGGTFYDTYANAQALVGGSGGPEPVPAMHVSGVTLSLDSGWMGDQKVNLSGAQINDNSFAPLSGASTTTCNLPPATINITKLAATPIDQPITVQRPVGDTFFRTTGNDCTYSYNLDTSSLLGPGDYTVDVVIDFQKVPNPAKFKLR